MQKKALTCIINCFEKYPHKRPILYDTTNDEITVFNIGWYLSGIGLRAYDLSSSLNSRLIKKFPEKALTDQCNNGALKYVIRKWLNDLVDDSLIIIRVMLSERICLSLSTLVEIIRSNLKENQKMVILAEIPKLKVIKTKCGIDILNKVIKNILDYLEANRNELIHWFIYDDLLNESIQDFWSNSDMQFYFKPKVFIISSNLIMPSFFGVYNTFLKPYESLIIPEKDNLVKEFEKPQQLGYITKYDPYDVFRMFYIKLKGPEWLYFNF